MSLREYVGFLRRAWRMFRGAKKTWRLPPRVDVMIVDDSNAEPILELLSGWRSHIVHTRGESLNVPAMIIAGPRLLLGAHHYLRAYRRLLGARLVISRVDNNLTLWRLKRPLDQRFQVLVIQNGWAWTSRGLPQSTADFDDSGLHVDRYAVFGNHAVRMTIGDPAAGSVRPILSGSMILNRFPISTQSEPSTSTIAVLSTFRLKSIDLPDQRLVQTRETSGADAYERLAVVLRRRNLGVRVYCCGRGELLERERSYFGSALRTCTVQFVERHNWDDSYRAIARERVVLSDVSTLGYEALGLGKRVGFINFPRHWQQVRFGFGWPLEFGERGPFWTNDPSEAEIERILDYLLTVSDEQWERDSGWIRDQLIVHDYGNTKLKRYVEGVLAGKGDVLAEEEAAASREHPVAPGRGPTREGAREAGHPDRGGEGRGPRG